MTKKSGRIDISIIKRCYVDLILAIKCPNCKDELHCDISIYPLCYPKAGNEETAYFYCKNCEKEFELPIKITKAELEIEYNEGDIYEI